MYSECEPGALYVFAIMRATTEAFLCLALFLF